MFEIGRDIYGERMSRFVKWKWSDEASEVKMGKYTKILWNILKIYKYWSIFSKYLKYWERYTKIIIIGVWKYGFFKIGSNSVQRWMNLIYPTTLVPLSQKVDKVNYYRKRLVQAKRDFYKREICFYKILD